MYLRRYALAVTVDASGDATVYSDGPVNGYIRQVRYVPHASTPLDTNADFVLSGETTGVAILTMTNIGTSAFQKVPQQPTQDLTAGAAALYAGGGAAVNAPIAMADERLKLVVAQGGNAKVGTFYVWVG